MVTVTKKKYKSRSDAGWSSTGGVANEDGDSDADKDAAAPGRGRWMGHADGRCGHRSIAAAAAYQRKIRRPAPRHCWWGRGFMADFGSTLCLLVFKDCSFHFAVSFSDFFESKVTNIFPFLIDRLIEMYFRFGGGGEMISTPMSVRADFEMIISVRFKPICWLNRNVSGRLWRKKNRCAFPSLLECAGIQKMSMGKPFWSLERLAGFVFKDSTDWTTDLAWEQIKNRRSEILRGELLHLQILWWRRPLLQR